MESKIILPIYWKNDVIKHIFDNLEPFLNIEKLDGIIFYRIVIILKIIFFLYSAENLFPKCVTWIMITFFNAFIIYNYLPIVNLLIVLQTLIFFLCSKKFALFSNMALICIFSMNIKPCEFILDINVTICLVTYAFVTYRHELQKFWIVIITKIFITWYACSFHTFNTKQFLLILSFLCLSYTFLKPNNKYEYRLFYFYTLVLIWMVYKFQVSSFYESKFQTVNSKLLKKYGYYEPIFTSNDANGRSFKIFQKSKMAMVSKGKLATKFTVHNSTSSNDEKICRIDYLKDENIEIIDKNLKSNNHLEVKERKSSEKVEITEKRDGKECRWLGLQSFTKNTDELRTMASNENSELNKLQDSLINDESIFGSILNSISMIKVETERSPYLLKRKLKKLLQFNTNAKEKINTNGEKVMKHQKPPLNKAVTSYKYKQNESVREKELNVDSSLKRERNNRKITIKMKNRPSNLFANRLKLLEHGGKTIKLKKVVLNKPIISSKYKNKWSMTKKGMNLYRNVKKEPKIMRTRMSEKKKTYLISGSERSKNEEKVIEYEHLPLSELIRLDKRKGLISKSYLKKGTKIVIKKKNRIKRMFTQNGPNLVKFKTLKDVMRENDPKY